MALKKEQIFAFLLFCLLGMLIKPVYASKAPANKSLELVKEQVHEQKKNINKLKDEINHLEKSLGQGNKRYVSIIENKQEVESRVYKLRSELNKTQDDLNKKKEKTESVLKAAILNKLSEKADPAKLLAEKIFFKSLAKELRVLKEEIQRNMKSKEELNQLVQNYKEFSKTEVELATFLNELENKKKSVVDTYLSEVEKEKKLEKRFSKLKLQFAMARAQSRKDEGLRFEAPLKEFEKFEHQTKGITFHYQGRKPVTSTASGKVVYSGELSAYGNVVMIDHGDETRSVVLGQFIPKVDKGLKVKEGDVLGYTSYNPRRESNSGKIYFEVRKKNKVQNTIELMNPSSLEREVLASR